MTIWAGFFNELLPSLPGCPEDLAGNAIRNATIRLCERTKAHKADLTPIPILANVATYAYAAPTGTVVIRVEEAWMGSIFITQRSQGEIQSLIFGNWRAATGTPLYLTGEDERTLRLVPIASTDQASALNLYVSLKPAEDAGFVADRIYQEYKTVIARGAKAELMMSPGMPYTQMTLGQALQKEFEDQLGDIAWKVDRAFGRARPRVKAHFI